MISKELLGEVMRKQIGGDEECKDIKIINNILYFTAFHKHKINFYELAHECREWALDLGYEFVMDYHTNRNTIIVYENSEEVYRLFSEHRHIPEDIFKACEWIKESK